uniref:Mitochondrial carrier protein n=1 Tax=Bicosoecida sp. CB-2014 TaxID=1486930 RepID=A0A7S1G657_9STRA|mmetsp:Transcript_14379/g.49996  ORF Transcript_14379/g.49996 Transcript_14379/m.49996 type:complete len:348 (+) Transcript_14379:229-1272(+)
MACTPALSWLCSSERGDTSTPAAARGVPSQARRVVAAVSPSQPKREIAAWKRGVSGLTAGVSGLTVVYPLDTTKLRLQTCPGEYKGAFDCLRTVVKREGFAALYRGMSAPIAGYGAINSLLLSTYGMTAVVLRRRNAEAAGGVDRELSMEESMAAGAVAGVVSTVLRAPVERVKAVMQVRRNPDGTKVFRNSWRCLVGTMRTEGLLSPFAAGRATLLRELFQGVAYFPAFEITKRALTPAGGSSNDLDFWRLLIAGGVAGITQWLPPMYCIDVVKSRMEVPPAGSTPGVLGVLRASVAKEGGMVLLRGMGPAMVRAFPMHATILTTNELMTAWLSKLEVVDVAPAAS